MNKSIITIVIIAALLAGGYFLFRSAPPSEPTSQLSADQTPATEEKIVTYADSGYSPATLTVKKGGTVTWKNQSSQSMWTASGKHPTHLLYPTIGGCLGSTFDACAGILPGNNWSFKFDIAGAWKYHNHLSPMSPGNTGTIVVE